MNILIDTHVHIYPFYDVAAALEAAFANLHAIDAGAKKILCLTEGGACDIYADLANNDRTEVSGKFEVNQGENSLSIQDRSGLGEIHMLPGQQVVTAENIEILSLCCSNRVEQRQPASDTVAAIIDAGGVPVVAWGLGKWLGGRGKIVAALMDQFDNKSLAFGDTSMRPQLVWPSSILSTAQKRDYRVLCGSDPLPYNGEESQLGRYVTQLDIEPGRELTDNFDPAAIIKEVLKSEGQILAAGRRGTISQVLTRQKNQSKLKQPY